VWLSGLIFQQRSACPNTSAGGMAEICVLKRGRLFDGNAHRKSFARISSSHALFR
jgi:hypothetical protein